MPRLVAIENGRAIRLSGSKFLDEAALQRLLEENPELIALDEVEAGALPLLPIGREVPLAGQSLDLLYIDAAGRLTAVETKLRRNPEIRRQVAGQVLEYGAYLSAWRAEDVERQAARYLADPRTPEAYRAASLCEALSRLNDESGGQGLDESELQSRIANALSRRDMRLVIAVDRIVDSLRSLVAFVDSSSSFGFYLLEIQEHRANSLHLASINVYGGRAADLNKGAASSSSGRGVWDEEKEWSLLFRLAGRRAGDVLRGLPARTPIPKTMIAYLMGISVDQLFEIIDESRPFIPRLLSRVR